MFPAFPGLFSQTVPSLFAQALAGYSWFTVIKIGVIIAAACMIVYIGLRWMGVNIPQPLLQMLGVVAIAAVILICLSLLWQL